MTNVKDTPLLRQSLPDHVQKLNLSQVLNIITRPREPLLSPFLPLMIKSPMPIPQLNPVEILPTTPPKTPPIGTSPLSNNNSHPVDSLEPKSLPESPETPLITVPSKKTASFADLLINNLSSLTLQPGNQPDYQLDHQPGYQPDPSTQLILWAVVSDDDT